MDDIAKNNKRVSELYKDSYYYEQLLLRQKAMEDREAKLKDKEYRKRLMKRKQLMGIDKIRAEGAVMLMTFLYCSQFLFLIAHVVFMSLFASMAM